MQHIFVTKLENFFQIISENISQSYLIAIVLIIIVIMMSKNKRNKLYDRKIVIKDGRIRPRNINIKVGQVIRWICKNSEDMNTILFDKDCCPNASVVGMKNGLYTDRYILTKTLIIRKDCQIYTQFNKPGVFRYRLSGSDSSDDIWSITVR